MSKWNPNRERYKIFIAKKAIPTKDILDWIREEYPKDRMTHSEILRFLRRVHSVNINYTRLHDWIDQAGLKRRSHKVMREIEMTRRFEKWR